jgi:hypothetical protein
MQQEEFIISTAFRNGITRESVTSIKRISMVVKFSPFNSSQTQKNFAPQQNFLRQSDKSVN